MRHISSIAMHFIEQSKLQNKTIMNNKSYYTRMSQRALENYAQHIGN